MRQLLTRWGRDIDVNSVLQEYPREMLRRKNWINLNGYWDYAFTGGVEKEGLLPQGIPEKWDGQILVPFCIESSLSGVGRRVSAEEALWYSTTFKVPSDWKKQRVMLNFGAVDWAADVYVNDQLAGHHTGGYTAFSFDVTPFLKGRGKQVTNPSGIWYTPVTGIWQSVWIEPVRTAAVTSYLAVPDIDAGTVDVTVFAEGEAVSVTGTSKGKGFAGVMKRYNFGGLQATHGVSVSHRKPASSGASSYPSHVFKGKTMPGQLGNERVTLKNLTVVAVDKENNLLLIKGAVPGAKNGLVLVRKQG